MLTCILPELSNIQIVYSDIVNSDWQMYWVTGVIFLFTKTWLWRIYFSFFTIVTQQTLGMWIEFNSLELLVSWHINPTYWFRLNLHYNQLILVYVEEEENNGTVCIVDMGFTFSNAQKYKSTTRKSKLQDRKNHIMLLTQLQHAKVKLAENPEWW